MYFNQQEKRSGSLFQGKFKATHLSGDFALPTVSAYINLNHKHHRIDPSINLVKSSIFEYLDQELGESICNPVEIQAIIKESDGLIQYKKFIKQASITFADNKGRSLNVDDFEF